MRVVAVSGADIDRMADRLFLEGRRKQSAFWVLLTLAAIIAGAGVVADSDATVIGAMIVAPLMTPILGTALAVVLADRPRIVRGRHHRPRPGPPSSWRIGFLLGLLVPEPVVAATNARSPAGSAPTSSTWSPSLATGLVGAFALVRDDVSDTLPGVAIAISLVPPLAVVGLTLESGAPGQALGALLLFASNVAAIIATGTGCSSPTGCGGRGGRRAPGRPPRATAPSRSSLARGARRRAARGGQLPGLPRRHDDRGRAARGRAVGGRSLHADRVRHGDRGGDPDRDPRPSPGPDVAPLRRALDGAGYADVPVEVSLVLGGSRSLPAAG